MRALLGVVLLVGGACHKLPCDELLTSADLPPSKALKPTDGKVSCYRTWFDPTGQRSLARLEVVESHPRYAHGMYQGDADRDKSRAYASCGAVAVGDEAQLCVSGPHDEAREQAQTDQLVAAVQGKMAENRAVLERGGTLPRGGDFVGDALSRLPPDGHMLHARKGRWVITAQFYGGAFDATQARAVVDKMAPRIAALGD